MSGGDFRRDSGGGRLSEGKLQRQLLRGSVREFTELQHKRVVRECEAMLGLTSVGIEHCREFKCLFRCFLIREDLYSDVGGPDIERMSVQCGGRYGDEAFRRRAMECVWNLQAQQLDRCELAYRVANDCVNGEVALLPIFLNVTGNLQFNSAFRGFTRGPPLLQRLSLFQRLPLFQNLPLWLTTPAV
uniref:General odorant-binding protein 45 n=1 Tax=Culex pipiens TaxID=7175 RepID=A0A8D8ITE9_CULPI